MRAARLPDGFGVRIDPSARTLARGRVLIGGTPARVISLDDSAAETIVDGYLSVTDDDTADLARRLLDTGIGNPRPAALPAIENVTVVIPVRDNAARLMRLLRALRAVTVIVVDDGSALPVVVSADEVPCSSVTVIRLDESAGAAAARNVGLRSATTEFVAFLDSDVIPHRGWLEMVLGHFTDPTVALVAPRVVALTEQSGAFARFEFARSPLDRGPREAQVSAGGRVASVPGVAMVVRRESLVRAGGFDASMHVAADVDLVRRLEGLSLRARYEPVARVAHENRGDLREWLVRSVIHGRAAVPLSMRHGGGDRGEPLPRWMLLAAALVAATTRTGLLGAIAVLAVLFTRLRRALVGVDDSSRVTAYLAAQGLVSVAWHLAAAMLRMYWPITAVAMVLSVRVRRLALAMAVVDGLWDWHEHRADGGPGPLTHVVFTRLGDLAYGSGLWAAAISAGEPRALVPGPPATGRAPAVLLTCTDCDVGYSGITQT